ncbi:MAG: hypothetical protein GY810_08655 [Aureispira sp.]|nr:hypothetical protein [Aureispira sp.]
MKLLDGFQQSSFNRKLTKRLAQRPQEVLPVSFQQAKTVGILFDLTELGNNREIILRYKSQLQSDRKTVKLLAYIDEAEVPDGLGFDCFCKKDLSWTSVPNNPLVEEFIQTPFDLLLSLHTHECSPLEYISAVSHSTFRIGHFQKEKTYCYDFMVYSKSRSVRVLLKQIEHYLEVINQNKSSK